MAIISLSGKRIWADAEATYGTDPGVTGSNMIRTIGATMSPYTGDRVTPEYGGDGGIYRPSLNVNPQMSMSFGTDLAGSGTAGTAPNFGVVLTACGLSETIVASTSVTYERTSDPMATGGDTSATVYFVMDDGTGADTYIMKGSRGQVGLDLSAGALPRFNFDMVGQYTAGSYNASPGSGTISNQEKALASTNTNTGTFSFDATSVCVQSFSIDNLSGWQASMRDAPNCTEALMTGTTINGSMTIRDPGVNTKNWITEAESHAGVNEIALNIVHGSTAGNIVTVACTKVQIADITSTDINGTHGWQFSLIFLEAPTVELT